ncbi:MULTISPECIES: DUF29 domain-containing protein [Planktothrix]|jgi:hypothetical protein|uniref:DUF29 domain-containing protein n=2 Tax=Planktothrix TaxID=54304 RepID=A0A4V0XUK8_PLAAG|nr:MULTISPECIES: DUF29 domain-containing protein [Planktothrix]CAD5941752.1 hypothetical protein NO108_02344 [Planktothrix rubescens]CAC5342216.1 conserved hypothetical protein [Planktothrix rubescens NIVA-CYA 18]CAD0227419.1 conserved hypothetical protein [Planktothrix agardhii]CAD5924811.1 hypothetical protein PCC7821_00896 [Planktothrix rubescens NIVA-CYA 18]CAD5966618.1 hypothetical protein NO758_03491 [Planktothrix agardhii]
MNSELSLKLNQLYEQDFHLWVQQTIQLLESKHFEELDCQNLIEELDSMGKNDKNALKSNLRILLMHLLKYRFQPEKRSNSWQYTIIEHRQRIEDALENSPSLKPFLENIFIQCYQGAKKLAAAETGLPRSFFPENCPFSIEETLNIDYLPDSDNSHIYSNPQ